MTEATPAFYDKTVPTSMLVSVIGWSLRASRVPAESRAAAHRLLDALLRVCAATGRFKLQLRPEFQPGQGLRI